MQPNPLVSCVIPTFNQGQFLEEAIQSVLNQTWEPLEVVVVDDGSKDQTESVLKKLAANDARVRFFHQENQGFAVAMNRAIQESKGEFICHLDSDDLMEIKKIEKQMALLQASPNIDLIHTAVTVIDENGTPLFIYRGEDVKPENFLARMLERSIMGNPTTLLGRRECWTKIPFLKKYKCSVDYDRVLRLAENYRFKYLDEPLTNWRRHKENLTNDLTPYRKEQLDILHTLGEKKIFEHVEQSLYSDEEKRRLKGSILFNMEKHKEAVKFLKALKSPKALFTLANAYFKLDEFKEAIDTYRAVLKQVPTHAACHNNLGVALCALAHQHFQKALEVKPDYLDAKSNTSKCPLSFTERELRDQLIPYQFKNV